MNIDNILMMSKIQKNMLSYTLCRINVYNLFMFISAYIFYKCMFKVLFVDLWSMEKLPSPLLQDFLQGQHVMRHQPGQWNAIWTDM